MAFIVRSQLAGEALDDAVDHAHEAVEQTRK